jgi:CRP/FNR family transcriptional regulator, cyclic AMP receptor protein
MAGPTANEKRELIEGHALFGGLAKTDLNALVSRAHIEHFRAGEQIFNKGAPGRSMMAILSGSVRISATSSRSREFVLTTLQAGEIFGEIALLDGQNRTADAIALTDCELLVLDRREFIPFLERRPDVCILLLKIFCHRLRHTDQQVEHAVFERIDTRLAKTLLRLASDAREGGPHTEPRVLVLISQQELAGMIGATRESINKRLHVWQKAGLVQLGKRLIVIPDIAAIEALA